jgi:hypothetical protein
MVLLSEVLQFIKPVGHYDRLLSEQLMKGRVLARGDPIGCLKELIGCFSIGRRNLDESRGKASKQQKRIGARHLDVNYITR